MGVDRTLEQCAQAQDPGLRKLAAFALNIWEGDAQANHRMEESLLALSYDDGHGAIDTNDKACGLEVRYKAVEGLAPAGVHYSSSASESLRTCSMKKIKQSNFAFGLTTVARSPINPRYSAH